MAVAATLGTACAALAADMIRVDVASKRFGADEILRDVRFDMARGETIALTGPSGIGKSTLLRLVAGIDIDFDGQIDRPDRLAIVFQEPTLLPWRTALHNITLVHPDLGQHLAQSALDRVGIGDRAAAFPGQLSLGQQRRLSLARAFAGKPDLLIMDEPFVSLDAATAEEMIILTEELIRETGPATLIVTHSKAEARRLATRILRLSGNPATIEPDPTKKENLT